jgi:hypothetical protein
MIVRSRQIISQQPDVRQQQEEQEGGEGTLQRVHAASWCMLQAAWGVLQKRW